jgi:glycerol kinase
MKKYILALDEGTTSARAILFDKNLNEICSSKHEIEQIYPKPGWVEQNPMDIYANQYSAMMECIAKSGVKPCEIGAIGITNQRETTIVWDKNTKKPIYNAIVWQCRRTSEFCRELENSVHAEYIKKVTGLKLDAYFSASKLKWILDNVEGAREKANQGKLLFGTIDTWLIWKLSGGKIHITDYTNASRTMLFDINKLCWDKKLLEILDIPENMLPEVKPCSEIYGSVNIMGAEVAISGIAGDQQAALFGQRCFNKGDIKNTYGTGCFLLMKKVTMRFMYPYPPVPRRQIICTRFCPIRA